MSRNARFLKESRARGNLSLPIILSQVAYTLLGLIDTVMSGQAGAEDQAAVALGVAFWVPVFVALMSIVQGISPIVAHHFGAQDREGVIRDSREGIWLAVFSSLIPLLLMPLVRPVMAWAQIDPVLAGKTMFFLWGIVVGLPAALIFRALSFYSASINHPRPMMVLAFVGLGVNTLFNWLLIWGHWGLPALGGAGCGWATAIGMWFALLALVIWTVFSPAYRDFYLWHGWSWPHWTSQWRLLKIGLPMGGAALAEVGAFSSIAVLVGRFGAVQIAAHQVALNFSSIIFMIPMGLSSAMTIRVGQMLGTGDARAARRVAWTGIALGLLIALTAIPIILLGRQAIVAIYSSNREVQQLAANLLLFAAIWQLVDAAQVTGIGALRGYKITVAPMLLVFAAFWLFGIPLGAWLGYTGITAPMGVYGFWIGLVTGLILISLGIVLVLWKVANALVPQAIDGST